MEFQFNKTIIYYLKSKNIEYKLCAELEFIETNPCNCKNTKLGNVKRDCRYKTEIRNCMNEFMNSYFLKKESLENCTDYNCHLESDSISYTYSFRHINYSLFFMFYGELKYTEFSEIPIKRKYLI